MHRLLLIIVALMCLIACSVFPAAAQIYQGPTIHNDGCRLYRMTTPNNGHFYVTTEPIRVITVPPSGVSETSLITGLLEWASKNRPSTPVPTEHVVWVQVSCAWTGDVSSRIDSFIKQLKDFNDTEVRKLTNEQIKVQLDAFARALEKAATDERKAIVERLIAELPNHPEVIDALKTALKAK